MSTEILPSQEQPNSLFQSALGAASLAAILLGLLYLVICVVSTVVLCLMTGLTEADAKQASFLSHRLGLQFHGGAFGVFCVFFGVMNVIRGSYTGFLIALLGIVSILATSERVALQQGILDGDLKIGCYSYESLECRKMLNVPTFNAPSIYNTPSERMGNGYADWYAPIRAKALSDSQALLPNTVPGVAFLKSAVTLPFHLSELKSKIAAQRAEVVAFQESFSKQRDQ